MGIRLAAVCALLAAATTASAAPTDNAALTFAVKAPTTPLRMGRTVTFAITITNPGPNFATGLALKGITLPATLTPGSTYSISDVTGATCASLKLDATGNFAKPCVVDGAVPGTLSNDPTGDANKTEVDVTVSWDPPVDDKGNTDLSAAVNTPCPTGSASAATGPGGAAVFHFVTTSTPAAFDTTPSAFTVGAWADLKTAASGPARADLGKQVTYTGSVTNAGPCDATNVHVNFFPNNALSSSSLLKFVSATGACTDDPQSADTGGDCDLATVPAKTPKSWTMTFTTPGSLPANLIQTSLPYAFDAYSYAAGKGPAFSTRVIGVWDPDDSDNTQEVDTRVGKEAGGCNVGGATGLLGMLLAGAAIRFARRRRS